MTEQFLNDLRALAFDELTAREAVVLRAALAEAMAKSDAWFAGLARDFAKPANPDNGRPPVDENKLSPPVKPPDGRRTPAKRRGRPVPDLKVDFTKRPPLAIGGADAPEPTVPAARLFENSYVSKDGPRSDVPALLPPDHPRRSLSRESSVTPEIDMEDFQAAEAALRNKGGMTKIFQG